MAKFQFSLERVAVFRRTQADVERNRLEQLQAKLESLRETRTELARRQQQSALGLARPGAITASWAAQAIDMFSQFVTEESGRLRGQEAAQSMEIQRQQQRVIEAERKVELLTKLRDRRHEAWRQEEGKALEELAADAYLAAWNKRLRNNH
jgi:flagellar biosynthesis chaperone FliJ